MKAVILAGGLGTRLYPLTQITNKHLLPVYGKPMIYYPIEMLVRSGIKELMVVVSGPHAGSFLPILQNGKQFGLDHLEYAYQTGADSGISDALRLAEQFASGENIVVVLGDNIIDCNHVESIMKETPHWDNCSGAQIFLKEVPDPTQFGVPKFDDNNIITEIVEKPISAPSNYAVIGLYLFDKNVFDYIRRCKPSGRNQLEITDVLNYYIEDKNLWYDTVKGFWKDTGCADNLYLANKYYYEKNHGS